MTKTLSLNFFVLLIGFHVGEILSFPDGAPSATCKNHRPSHGANSQPFQTLPFQVEASAEEYKSGDRIAVRISSKKEGIYFKGFFIQAMGSDGSWIGTFAPTAFSVSHPECSMTTHADNQDKEEVTVIWIPRKGTKGKVYFVASILKDYKKYWVDIPATPTKQ